MIDIIKRKKEDLPINQNTLIVKTSKHALTTPKLNPAKTNNGEQAIAPEGSQVTEALFHIY
jgi:hypothetical protein